MFYREDLNRLPYLTQCIKEGMRMHAPVPMFGRELTRDLTIGGVTLPKDARINVNTYCVHHNPHVWGADHMVCNHDHIVASTAKWFITWYPSNC